jgi:Protein of unknown function (DUF1573)
MKNIFSIFAFLVFGALAVTAQPVMTFDQTTIDYGIIDKGAEPHREYKFTNTGNEPLIIKNAKGSCGCTTPSVPEKPIMPGESDVIKVRYDTQRVGAFTKNVTVTTNEVVDTHTLTIKGEVKGEVVQEGIPAAAPGLIKQK